MLLKLAEMGAYRRTAKISTEYLAGKAWFFPADRFAVPYRA